VSGGTVLASAPAHGGAGQLWVTISPDGRTVTTLSSGGGTSTVRRWTVPAPEEGTPEQVVRRLRAITGMELDEEGTVRRLDPRTGRGTLIRLGGALAGIAYGQGALWVAKSSAGVVVRLDPRSGSRTSVRTGDEPGAVAEAGRDVLTTVLPSQAAHRGGTLTVLAHLDRADQSTDPAIAFTGTQWQLLSVTNDGLVTYQRTGGPAGNSLVPDLATALPAPADDGRTYVFHVRRGIRYSTGGLVQPDDFRRGIERDFIVNKGHYFGTAQFNDQQDLSDDEKGFGQEPVLSDDDKRALIELLKTF
jgi:hypothetical protein